MIEFVKKIVKEYAVRILLIVIVILLVLLSVSVFRNKTTKHALEVCRKIKPDTVSTVVSTIEIDTFYTPVIDTFYSTYDKHPLPDSTGIRVYTDTTKTEVGSIYSTSFVRGYLQRRRIVVDFKTPEIHANRLTTKTITVWKERRYNKFYITSDFAGRFGTGKMDVNLGITFIPASDRYYYHYSYSPFSKVHSFGVGYRLFRY